jgi:anti-sigma factor RsiW
MGPECIFVIDHYNDYISGELDTEGTARVKKHISACPNCDVFLGRFVAFHGKTVQLLRVQAPPSLKQSISKLIDKI